MKPHGDDPRLRHSLQSLQPSARARQVCARLGLESIGDFLAVDGETFLATPGCGRRTYDDLHAAVEAYLAVSSDSGVDRARPLLGLVRNPRAEKAFLQLGLKTVGDFLDTPKERLLAVRGFGERTWQQVCERIRTVTSSPLMPRALLPDNLRRLPIGALGLEDGLAARLAEQGCQRFDDVCGLAGNLWEEGGGLGPAALQAVREAVEVVVRLGVEEVQADLDGADFPRLQQRLFAPLDDGQREFLCARIGLGKSPRTLAEMSVADGGAVSVLEERERHLRRVLLQGAPQVLRRLRRELQRELSAFEGAVTGEHLAPGTLAHVAAKATGDPLVPLRLAAFCFPDHFHLMEGCLVALPPHACRAVLRRIQDLTVPHRLPSPLAEIEEELRPLADPVPRGLLERVLVRRCHLQIDIDPVRGEMVGRSARSRPARLEEILSDLGRPLPIDDLLFHYRDRFGHARRARLLDTLSNNDAFLQVGADTWSLRRWHLDELEMVRDEAERVANLVLARGGCDDALGLLDEPGGERACHLLLDRLRHDPRLRDLGRGAFCPRGAVRSRVMEDLLKAFRRAMGEVPLARFIANQPPRRRRLVASLLRNNRAFVQIGPDRVDVLTNYPFNEERLRRLLEVVDGVLEEQRGHAALGVVREAVCEAELGGSWLTHDLLRDLLRRHGHYEMLPGDMVASKALRLGSWIQARAREAMRLTGMPLSIEELLAEAPELAEFGEGLGELLEGDPMVQSADGGMHWQVV